MSQKNGSKHLEKAVKNMCRLNAMNDFVNIALGIKKSRLKRKKANKSIF